MTKNGVALIIVLFDYILWLTADDFTCQGESFCLERVNLFIELLVQQIIELTIFHSKFRTVFFVIR